MVLVLSGSRLGSRQEERVQGQLRKALLMLHLWASGFTYTVTCILLMAVVEKASLAFQVVNKSVYSLCIKLVNKCNRIGFFFK